MDDGSIYSALAIHSAVADNRLVCGSGLLVLLIQAYSRLIQPYSGLIEAYSELLQAYSGLIQCLFKLSQDLFSLIRRRRQIQK